LHFFVAVERQDRDEPVIALPNRNDVPDPSSQRAHPDSVGRFLDILENTYGVTDETGVFSQTQDEWSIFARLDWQISPKHRLTGRYNYTDLEQLGDRIGTDETFLNGGIFNNTGRSAVLQLNSIFKPTLWNDFRAQLAFEPRPREANTLLPESEVNVVSDWPDGTSSSLRGMECCNDAVLPNNLEETTLELVDNLNILVQQHQVKLGAHFNLFDYENFFFFNQQGQFDFNSLSDFENGIVDDFGRNLPNPGPDGEFFTDDDVTPIAIYKTYELAMYAQDAWRASDQFTLTGGVRLDLTRIPDAAPLNTELEASLGIRTDEKPEGTYFSPRIGFTYDPSRVGTSVFRGGVGLFYGRFPSVLYSNSLLNTGANQLNLFCQDEEAPVPDYDAYKQDLRNIPTACVGGAEAAAPIPNINAFDADFKYPKTWKFSAGYEQEVFRGFRVGIDALYATTTQNFYVEDRNLLDEQFRSGIENRPVHAPADELSSSSGRPGFGDNRIDTDFGQVLLHTSPAEARTWQATFTIGQRGNGWSWNFGYTWNNSRDNASYSCCISSTAQFEGGHQLALAGRNLADLLGPPVDSDHRRRRQRGRRLQQRPRLRRNEPGVRERPGGHRSAEPAHSELRLPAGRGGADREAKQLQERLFLAAGPAVHPTRDHLRRAQARAAGGRVQRPEHAEQRLEPERGRATVRRRAAAPGDRGLRRSDRDLHLLGESELRRGDRPGALPHAAGLAPGGCEVGVLNV
jgi:hypothetical protein